MARKKEESKGKPAGGNPLESLFKALGEGLGLIGKSDTRVPSRQGAIGGLISPPPTGGKDLPSRPVVTATGGKRMEWNPRIESKYLAPVYSTIGTQRGFVRDETSPTGWSFSSGTGTVLPAAAPAWNETVLSPTGRVSGIGAQEAISPLMPAPAPTPGEVAGTFPRFDPQLPEGTGRFLAKTALRPFAPPLVTEYMLGQE